VRGVGERRALWASTADPGGIGTYVHLVRHSRLGERWAIRLVVTHRSGSAVRRTWTFLSGVLQFAGSLVRERPALVHLHAASRGSLVRKGVLVHLSSWMRVPVLLHLHGSHIPTFYAQASPVVRWAIRRTLERSTAVAALGESWVGRITRIAPRARVVALPNAVRVAERTPPPAPGAPVRVVFLGVFSEDKGVFTLLDAWARSPHKGSAVLTLAGAGDVAGVESRVAALGIGDSVEVLPWLSAGEVESLLRRSHVLVLVSRSEGQSMAVLEAMAHGLCVVASEVGGLPEMLADGCGVLVPPDDVAATATALAEVVDDAAVRDAYGAAAHRRVIERYDLDTAWRGLDDLYREVSA
jgi:glycosyltransferase involved in cell wall biosynthesis